MAGKCSVGDPKITLGVVFETDSGKSFFRGVGALKLPGTVRHGLETVCKKAVGAAEAGGEAVADAAVTVAGAVSGAVGEHAGKGLKTFGAIAQLRPQDIPPDYAQAIYQKLQASAQNAPDPLAPKGAADGTSVSDFGLLNKAAGWFGYDGSADLGAVFYLDKDNNLRGAVGTITIPLK